MFSMRYWYINNTHATFRFDDRKGWGERNFKNYRLRFGDIMLPVGYNYEFALHKLY